ncbi:hypothetical protein Anapl_05322 [Anas platyrhynchos]|uniref:Uncharacterized protein n=1 Tax=Anas platyrhynchos TaxID=8839 RepID=R0M8P1_ANAPL|nr:hypothetical protein Anapl_05322 [Anas platyrhynchos]
MHKSLSKMLKIAAFQSHSALLTDSESRTPRRLAAPSPPGLTRGQAVLSPVDAVCGGLATPPASSTSFCRNWVLRKRKSFSFRKGRSPPECWLYCPYSSCSKRGAVRIHSAHLGWPVRPLGMEVPLQKGSVGHQEPASAMGCWTASQEARVAALV